MLKHQRLSVVSSKIWSFIDYFQKPDGGRDVKNKTEKMNKGKTITKKEKKTEIKSPGEK